MKLGKYLENFKISQQNIYTRSTFLVALTAWQKLMHSQTGISLHSLVMSIIRSS